MRIDLYRCERLRSRMTSATCAALKARGVGALGARDGTRSYMDRVTYGPCSECPGIIALAAGEPPTEPDLTGLRPPKAGNGRKRSLRATGRPISLAMKIRPKEKRRGRPPGWLTTREIATSVGLAPHHISRHLRTRGVAFREPYASEAVHPAARLWPEEEVRAWLEERRAMPRDSQGRPYTPGNLRRGAGRV